MSRRDDRTRVDIFTRTYRINGEVTLMHGSRLTDYIVDSKEFFAVTNARVLDHAGREVLSAPFINVARDQIELLVPS